MNAQEIAAALGGKRAGSGWVARCPAHDDAKPSLSIHERNGKVLLYCHAGCSWDDITNALRRRGIAFHGTCSVRRVWHDQESRQDKEDESRRSLDAIECWNSAVPATGTPVEAYLKSRGITLPPPSSLRFMRMFHPSGVYLPCMVALVQRAGASIAIHRTFLMEDGSGKAPVTPAKMMLGPCAGGFVLLGKPAEKMAIAEGVESALSAQQVFKLPTMAALSAPGLRAVVLPQIVKDLIVFADKDDPGLIAAKALRARCKGSFIRVDVCVSTVGNDANDLLMGGSR